jgi:hypothetical protein
MSGILANSNPDLTKAVIAGGIAYYMVGGEAQVTVPLLGQMTASSYNGLIAGLSTYVAPKTIGYTMPVANLTSLTAPYPEAINSGLIGAATAKFIEGKDIQPALMTGFGHLGANAVAQYLVEGSIN